MSAEASRITRLPPDHEYHASGLKQMCDMPQLLQVRYPDFKPHGTLKTLGGTAGHKVMEDWLLRKFNSMDQREVEDYWFTQLEIAAQEDGDKSGFYFPTDELHLFAAEQAEKHALQIRGFQQWWIDQQVRELLFVEGEYELLIPGSSDKVAPYRLVGRIDLCYIDRDGKTVIADWKFGKLEKQNTSDQWVLDMHYQLSTYVVGAWLGTTKAQGKTFTDIQPDYCGLILMDDFLPYVKRTTISTPTYMTNAKARWIEECKARAAASVKDIIADLEADLRAKRQDAKAYPNNKTKQKSAEVAHRRLQEAHDNPPLYHEVGDLRGPGFHETTFSGAALEAHYNELRARMASTRMANGIVRRRSKDCAFCFWRKACLKDWNGQPVSADDIMAEMNEELMGE